MDRPTEEFPRSFSCDVMPMDHFPIFLNVKGRPVLVAGGGGLAAQRIRQLLSAAAEVWVVAPALNSELEQYRKDGSVRYAGPDFPAVEGLNPIAAFGASEDAALNHALHAWAQARRIPVHVVDRPDLCTFIMPAIVDRSPLVVAVSTGGHSPTLARLLRERLEAFLPH